MVTKEKETMNVRARSSTSWMGRKASICLPRVRTRVVDRDVARSRKATRPMRR